MYKNIFVAIDDSPTSQKALAEAIQIARIQAAHLCIAHAADESLLAQHGMGLGSYIDVERTKTAIRDTARNLLETAAATATAAGIVAETRLLEATDKRVAEQIAAGAEAFGADLIVIGTHGRRGFARLLVGSVAENLLRIATTSLLLVREQ